MNVLVVPPSVVPRQNGQARSGAALPMASRADMLTPISAWGCTPMKSASERFTRKTLSGFVVGHDEIADGIENLDPVPVGLVHARKQAGIFQGHRGVAGDGLQDLVVFVRTELFAISQAQDAYQFSRRAQQPHQGALASTQFGGQRWTELVPLHVEEMIAPSCRSSASSMAWLNRRSNERS